jgi:hypothetical protein
MVLLYAPYAGACPAFSAEIFPTRVRYTALSIGYNIAIALFDDVFGAGDRQQPRASRLSHHRRDHYAVILLRTGETAFAPLR